MLPAVTDHGEYLGDSGLIEKWPTGMNDCLLKEPLIIGASLSAFCVAVPTEQGIQAVPVFPRAWSSMT